MRDFPELARIKILVAQEHPLTRIQEEAKVKMGNFEFPIYSFEIGSKDITVPTLALIGGVHGLERVGTQAVLAYLESLFEQLKWDLELHKTLEKIRIVSIPLLNPGGMYSGTRSNPFGVDLMRNAPIEAEQEPGFLIGGHRLSSLLPWYRGPLDKEMEIESKALVHFIKRNLFASTASLALDFHSGFGSVDRLWYPYAKSRKPFPMIQGATKIKELLDKTYPNHVYHIEPQSLSYTTHGDLWDYLLDEYLAQNPLTSGKSFIPWTLEMGSWNWIRKNPLQALSRLGVFNPTLPHRHKRMMRRHLPLVDFFFRMVKNHSIWSRLSDK